MPLAHPLSIHLSANYSQPSIAITFATAIPGEDVESFQARISDVGPWGQSGVGRNKVELVLTKESASRLVEMIATLD